MDSLQSISVVLGIYALVIFAIAYFSNLKTKNLDDYVLGGRDLSGPVTALGAGASDMSGWLLMGLPGAAYINGISTTWMALGLIVGAYTNWSLVAKRLRVFTEQFDDAVTIPEYLRARFTSDKNDVLIKIIIAILFVIFFAIYSSSGLIGGALLLKSIFHISYLKGLFLVTGTILLYTALGGFLAVNRVDFFQGILMMIALLVVPITIFIVSNDAISTMRDTLPNHFSLFHNIGWLGVISYFAWGLGYFGQPHILVRFMAIRHYKDIPLAKNICTGWMLLTLSGAITVGLFGRALYPTLSESPEIIFVLSAKDLFPAIVTGVLLSAVLSAVMSTVSALYLMSASALVSDIGATVLKDKLSDRTYLWLTRLAVVLIAIISAYLSIHENQVLAVVALAWCGLGSAFGPVILYSLFLPKMSYKAAVSGLAVGSISVLTWNIIASKYAHVGFFADVLPGFELCIGFCLSSITILGVTHFFPQRDEKILEKYRLCTDILKST